MLPDGFALRSEDGRDRIVKNSDWSPSKPWMVFFRGTNVANFATCQGAIECLTMRGTKNLRLVPTPRISLGTVRRMVRQELLYRLNAAKSP